MSQISGALTLWRRDMLRFRRDKMRVLGSLIFPLLFLLILGGGLRGSIAPLAGDVGYVEFLYPGVIAMSVIMTALMAGISIVWDREFGFFKEVLVAPISRWAVAGGKTLGGATVALAQGAILFVLAPLVGVDLAPWPFLKALPLMFLVALSLSALGVFIASRVKSMEAFPLFTQALVFPLVFLSGAFFPVRGLPAALNVIVKANPITYGVDAIRQALLGPGQELGVSLWGHTMTMAEDALVVAALGVALSALAAWSFSRPE